MRLHSAVFALAVASCSQSASPEVTLAPSTTATTPTSSTTTVTPSTTETPETRSPNPDPTACPDDIREAAAMTADGQHLALIDGDFERALTFSSAAFRAGVDPNQFAEIIASGYPFLLTASPSEPVDCLIASGVVALTVRFTLDTGTEVDLAYRMIEEAGRYAIEAAGVLPPPEIDV